MQNASSNGSKKNNGHNGDWYDDILNHDMDMDDHPSQNNNWDQMDIEDSSENQVEYQRLVDDTLAYGRDLQQEFANDTRREVRKALDDAFALMAYTDPLSAKGVSHLLDASGRVAVAEELNAAILRKLPFLFLLCSGTDKQHRIFRQVVVGCSRANHPANQRSSRRPSRGWRSRCICQYRRFHPTKALSTIRMRLLGAFSSRRSRGHALWIGVLGELATLFSSVRNGGCFSFSRYIALGYGMRLFFMVRGYDKGSVRLE